LIVELVPHLDAEDRALSRGDDDERPLSDLGRRQARALVALLSRGPIHALFSSPARRCIQTLEPMAAFAGLPVVPLADLRQRLQGRESAEALAERGLNAIEAAAAESGGSRIIVCSHLDIIPAVAELLARKHGLALGRLISQRGEWYTINLAPGQTSIRLCRAPDEFPR
jgi:8-oxo-dGTP diphosphatase